MQLLQDLKVRTYPNHLSRPWHHPPDRLSKWLMPASERTHSAVLRMAWLVSNFQPHVGSGHNKPLEDKNTQRKNGFQNFEIDYAHLMFKYFFELDIWKLGNTFEFLLSIAWRSSRSSLLPALPVKRPLFEAPCARKQNPENKSKQHKATFKVREKVRNYGSTFKHELFVWWPQPANGESTEWRLPPHVQSPFVRPHGELTIHFSFFEGDFLARC